MMWFLALVVLVALVGLAALLGWAAYVYVQFCGSPEKRWREKVLGLVDAAGQCVRAETNLVRDLRANHDAEARSMQETAFRSYLSKIQVSELEAYPGIGRATIDKLRGAGFASLARLAAARIQIYGLGEKRLADIDNAVRDLLRKARSNFECKGCHEAQALVEDLEQTSAKYDTLEVRSLARTQAAKEVIGLLRHQADAAQGVTFWCWLRRELEQPLVPPELLNAPLPDLNTAVRAADARAKQTEAIPAVIPLSGRTSQQIRQGAKPVQANPVAILVPATQPVIEEYQGPPAPHAKQTPSAGKNLMGAAGPIPPIPGPLSPAPLAVPDAKSTGKPSDKPKEGTHNQASSVAQNTQSAMSDTHFQLLELTIQFALAVARHDGPVTSDEREVLRHHIRRRFSYDPAWLNRAEALCAHYESASIDFDSCLVQINQQLTQGHRAALVEFACQIVAASMNRGSGQEPFLHSLAQRLGVQPPPLASYTKPEQLPRPNTPHVLPNAAASQTQPSKETSASPARPSPRPASPVPPGSSGPWKLTSDPPPPPSLPFSAAPSASSTAPQTSTLDTRRNAALTRDECLAMLEIQPTISLSADLIRRQWNLVSQRLDLERAAKMGPEFAMMAEAKLASLRRAAEHLLEPMGEKLETISPATTEELRHNPDLDDVFGL
jgi:uncharacterized tellurite resistance protein B-like protein